MGWRVPGCGDCELLSDSDVGKLKHIVIVQWDAGYQDVEIVNFGVTRLLVRVS